MNILILSIYSIIGLGSVFYFFRSKTVDKPWGYYTVLFKMKNICVKKIVVNPNSKLSLQSHKHRSELWFVTSGSGEVVLNDLSIQTDINKTIYIPQNAVHRVSNSGKTKLVFYECQMGELIDENDILRIDDIYGRV